MAEASIGMDTLTSIVFASVIFFCMRRINLNYWTRVFLVYLVQLVTRYWCLLVDLHVPSPYLDEYFHIPQALAYWNGQWHVWDPKITTPPGLYILTYPWIYYRNLLQKDETFTFVVRAVSSVAHLGISLVLEAVLRTATFWKQHGTTAAPDTLFESLKVVHIAFDICLFPPLFFFSALYYTDIPSVLSVLLTFTAFVRQSPPLVFLFGLISLTFRQTNIFWVAVYLGGEEVVRSLKRLQGSDKRCSHNGAASLLSITRYSWERGAVYDPLIREAWFEDYLKSLVSFGVAALAQVCRLALPLVPYVSLLGAFGVFVLWNGGVVLGDKENHIASIHLMQMLYIWPYITFFSFPILLPSLIPSLLSMFPPGAASILPDFLQPIHSAKMSLPRLIVLLPVLAVALTTIHYNTLIHPFTLADNRHYTFYVFRLLIRQPWTKYLVSPIYVFFGWACINVLGGTEPSEEFMRHAKLNADSKTDNKIKLTEHQGGRESARVSFVLLWLSTSTLCLASTPLVEPRYFILPWIVWRLHVPTRSLSRLDRLKESTGSVQRTTTKTGWQNAITAELTQSYPLYLETLWFLVVNFCTGYLFLFRGFTWPSEPGSVQRFMW